MSVQSQTGPQRQSVAAFAWITRQEQGRTAYLAQWNLHWRALNLPGGHKQPDESFRDCVIREVGEELGLMLGDDYEIGDELAIRLEFEAFSQGAWELTAYILEVFRVVQKEGSALARIAANPDNRWVTEAEILAGRCNDGTKVSPTMTRFLMMTSRELAQDKGGDGLLPE
jgi:8-oxo-dGTP pyrophosphatase MutT (NUDIX family)